MYGFTAGMRRARHRALIADVSRHFGFTGYLRGRLPTIAYDDVAATEVPVILPRVLGRPGNVSEAELIAISRCVAVAAPRSILEIGTFDGRTTLALAANAPADATVFTLDLPADAPAELTVESRDLSLIKESPRGDLFAGSPFAPRIHQILGDSATYDFGDLVIDLAFIDGAHSYEYALSDSRRVRAMLRGGRGTIIWHDYGVDWEGVTMALDELSREPEFAGIARVEGTTLALLRV